MNQVLLALHRIGPYHHARFVAAARQLPLAVLETRPRSLEYPWQFQADGNYPIYQLQGACDPEQDPPTPSLERQLKGLLDQLNPAVVVSVGWADRSYQRLLLACHRKSIPLVIVSDSRERDEPRFVAKELIKSQLLRAYSAALVAGSESRAYLEGLGFPPSAIYEPWDVVDNALIEQFSVHLPPPFPHFLCVSRLVAKKNHFGLLEAYAEYQRQGGSWGLQLVGSGPLQAALEARISALPNASCVKLQPFCQQNNLLHLYAQASAFVLSSSSDQWGLVVNEAMAAGLPCLVSSACGCVADLIEQGVTGWCFDSESPASLTALMHALEQLPSIQRLAVVAAARQRLQAYSPQRFAHGLQQAVRHALLQPRFSRFSRMTAVCLRL